MEKFQVILAALLALSFLMAAVPAVADPREAACAAVLLFMVASNPDPEKGCKPTAADALGPFYQSGAPERGRVGQGYRLSGVVRSAADCAPIQGARLEFWLAGPDGNYDDAHRATVLSGAQGTYRFESNFPPQYSSRPPHIHLKVSAAGFKTLVTQHYPVAGDTQGIMDLVLIPAP